MVLVTLLVLLWLLYRLFNWLFLCCLFGCINFLCSLWFIRCYFFSSLFFSFRFRLFSRLFFNFIFICFFSLWFIFLNFFFVSLVLSLGELSSFLSPHADNTNKLANNKTNNFFIPHSPLIKFYMFKHLQRVEFNDITLVVGGYTVLSFIML